MKPLLVASFVLSAPLHAAVLSQYTFASNTLAATTTGSGVSAGTITNGGGYTLKQSGFNLGGSGPQALGWASNQSVPGSVAEALSQNQFFTFTLTPNAGQQISLTGITFLGNAGADTALARSFELQVSTNGTDFSTIGTGTLISGGTGANATFGFSLESYTAITTQTKFRFVAYDVANDDVTWSDGSWIRLDDITVNGTVSPIPEPSGIALAALGLLGLATRRRRA